LRKRSQWIQRHLSWIERTLTILFLPYSYIEETDGYPTDEILQALGGLPLLKDLRLGCFTIDIPAVASFAHLERLKLTCPKIVTWSGVKSLIKNSPQLASLELAIVSDTENCVEAINFADLFAESNEAPDGTTLRSLTLDICGIPPAIRLTGPCAPFLRRLETLHFENRDPTPTVSGFWKAMAESGVHLRSLKVPELELDCAKYASSYSGLECLRITTWDTAAEGLEDIAKQLFDCVIPRHCGTLHTLALIRSESFEGHYRDGPWCLTERGLRQVLRCRELRELEFAISFVEMVPGVPIVRVISYLQACSILNYGCT